MKRHMIVTVVGLSIGTLGVVSPKVQAATTPPISQVTMSKVMWNVFDSTQLNVHTHPTMVQAATHPTTQPVTAGDIATWLRNWAEKSKGINLKYETSTNPYFWALQNNLYQQTSVKSSKSHITTKDELIILSNLKWWLNGYRKVGHTVQMHVPMDGNRIEYTSLIGEGCSISEYRYSLAESTNYFDHVTVTQIGNKMYLHLPSLQHTVSHLEWQVGALGLGAQDLYGYTDALNTEALGQKATTLAISLKDPAFTVSIESPLAYLNGYSIGHYIKHGKVDWTDFVDLHNNINTTEGETK